MPREHEPYVFEGIEHEVVDAERWQGALRAWAGALVRPRAPGAGTGPEGERPIGPTRTRKGLGR